jgi:hypothetical protein
VTKQTQETPQNMIDPQLGSLPFIEDGNTWTGHYQGYSFHVAGEGNNRPAQDLIDHCVTTFNKPQWLTKTLAEQKTKAKTVDNSE